MSQPSSPGPTQDDSDPAVRKALEKYDRESVVRDALPRWAVGFVTLVCVLLAAFHLYTSFSGPLVDVAQRSIHLYTLLALTFILYPITKKACATRCPGSTCCWPPWPSASAFTCWWWRTG